MIDLTDATYFTTHIPSAPWIVEGIVREKQITALGAAFNVCKSPMLRDLAAHVVHGIPWLGRTCTARPVIYFDFETSVQFFQQDFVNTCNRLTRAYPLIPSQLLPFLAIGSSSRDQLLQAAKQNSNRLFLLKSQLQLAPNALIIIDPLQLMFLFDTNKAHEVMAIYTSLRTLMNDFPSAGVIGSFNLRKPPRGLDPPDLLNAPNDWLNEITGSMAVMNRCDIRIGLDRYGPDARVMNGAIRGEIFNPILFRSIMVEAVEEQETYAGFERIDLHTNDLALALTTEQLNYYRQLPMEFSSKQGKELMPKTSFYRLIARSLSLGAIERKSESSYVKRWA